MDDHISQKGTGELPVPDLCPESRGPAFHVVLAIEIWERFGFYGMQAILLLYMIQKLGLQDMQANMLWGSFAAMTYAAPVAGGWLGDRVLGSRRTMVVGGIVLASGYLLLGMLVGTTQALFVNMAVIAVGNGLFKPNSCNMVNIIYRGQDQKLDVAFTIYYMSVNIGSTFSLFLVPLVQQSYGWGAAFIFCGLGLLLGVGGYFIRRSRLAAIGTVSDFRPVPWRHGLLVAGGAVAVTALMALVFASASIQGVLVVASGITIILAWAVVYARAAVHERTGLRIMYLLTFQVALYFVFYQQMVTSLTLFALRNVNKDFTLWGLHLFSMSAGQFQVFNPVWIMLGTPMLIAAYNWLGRRDADISIAGKFVIGFFCVTLSFLAWWLSTVLSSSDHVSPWVMLFGYGPLSIGELMINSLGLAAIARYVPVRISAFMAGCYYVLVGFAMYVGSIVANMAAVDNAAGLDAARTLVIYGSLFRTLAFMAGGATVMFALLLPMVRRWEGANAMAER
ncbi:peptide MFS transporter [Komagataeibacter medellinensis]|uniref:Amino acid transporter n=1 Tax=Komagataeibacter medellinensis (strain NBRC 3288 / BCRC 11682 / LMG 1693 / Kondo 51) TaxID=634177 RepID=G2I3E7_KOMMN|nr:oligopeptide:H+ symporter [Komagataeibacter medellinensis]BAK82752.1 amino acid transporter [Komagataeibacter medellinensis NBRC 3288]